MTRLTWLPTLLLVSVSTALLAADGPNPGGSLAGPAPFQRVTARDQTIEFTYTSSKPVFETRRIRVPNADGTIVEKIVTVQRPVVETRVRSLPLDRVEALTPDGKPVTADNLSKRLAAGDVVAVFPQKPDTAFLALLKPTTLVLVVPDPQAQPPAFAPAAVPVPRQAVLTPGAAAPVPPAPAIVEAPAPAPPAPAGAVLPRRTIKPGVNPPRPPANVGPVFLPPGGLPPGLVPAPDISAAYAKIDKEGRLHLRRAAAAKSETPATNSETPPAATDEIPRDTVRGCDLGGEEFESEALATALKHERPVLVLTVEGPIDSFYSRVLHPGTVVLVVRPPESAGPTDGPAPTALPVPASTQAPRVFPAPVPPAPASQ